MMALFWGGCGFGFVGGWVGVSDRGSPRVSGTNCRFGSRARGVRATFSRREREWVVCPPPSFIRLLLVSRSLSDAVIDAAYLAITRVATIGRLTRTAGAQAADLDVPSAAIFFCSSSRGVVRCFSLALLVLPLARMREHRRRCVCVGVWVCSKVGE